MSKRIIFRKFETTQSLENYFDKFGKSEDIKKYKIKIFFNPKNELIFYFLTLEY